MEKLTHNELAPLVLRLGLAVVFIYHGMGKIGPEKAWGTGWHKEMHVVLQTLVSWGEFLGGVALVLGFLTRLAGAGIIVIMAGAIATVHGKNGFSLQTGGYEFCFVLIAMATAVVLMGSGPLSLDHCLWRKKTPPHPPGTP